MDLSQAPGCYGSALTFSETEPVCRNCPFAAGCEPRSKASLASIYEKLGIPDKRRALGSKRPADPAPNGKLTLGLSKMTVELMDHFNAQGLRVSECLRNGVNPFVSTSKGFMRIICHMMLKRPSGIDQVALKRGLMEMLKWTDENAQNHVTAGIQALRAVGAIREVDGKIQIRRDE